MNETHRYTQKQWSANYARGTNPCFIHAVTLDIGNCVGVDTKEGRWHHKQLSSSGQWWQLSQCLWSPWDLLGRGTTLLPPPFDGQGVSGLYVKGHSD